MFDILIIDKLKKISLIKVMNLDNLYKKIGLKTEDGFLKQCEWCLSISHYSNLYINIYGKKIGKANNENKYNFPPPLDKDIFFGKCIIVAYTKNNKENQFVSLTEELWNNIYINLTTINESIIDIPKSKKVFIKNEELNLSSSCDEEEDEEEDTTDEEEEDIEDDEVIEDTKEEIIEKLYLNNEIELIEELYLSNSDDEEEDEEDEDDDDAAEVDDDNKAN